MMHNLPNCRLDTLLEVHVQRWRQSPEVIQDDFRVLRRAEAKVIAVSEPAKQQDLAAFVAEPDRRRRRNGIQQSDDADDGRRKDRSSECLVVETNVPAGNRNLKEVARL